jgi:hypothetical protein
MVTHNPPVTSTESARTARRPSRLVAVVAAAALLLAAVAWWVLAGRSAGGVLVSWTPTCSGTEAGFAPPASPGTDDPLAGAYVVDVRPGFACEMRVEITNTSRWTAHLSAIEAPLMGPLGGGEIRAEPDPAPPALRPNGLEEVDATFPLDRDVAPGDSTTVTVRISWREAGCNGAGSLEIHGWPSVEFRLMARDHEARSTQRLGFRTHDGDHVAPTEEGC